ncbi:MAG: PHP domain-containing protein [Eubacteriales bacterium]
MIYDFHMHTINSDGSLPAYELVKLAKQANVDVMCITDHDTLSSITEAEKLSKIEKDIEIHGGLEISTYISSANRHAHILAYRCNKDNKALKAMVDTTLKRRTESFYKSVDIINKHGDFQIEISELEKYKKSDGMYKQHIMKYLLDAGYVDDLNSDVKRKMFSRSSGYAFVGFEYPECTYAIEAVRNAGGIPVLAHTFYSDNFHAVDEMIEAGLMGIEVYHPKHNEHQMQLLDEFCMKRNLLETCGSDFHGIFNDVDTDIGKTSVDNSKIREFLEFLRK